MSIQSIRTWYERGYNVVAENGSHWVRLRLTSDGQVWQTWDKGSAGFPSPDDFQTELTSLFESLSEELPVRQHTFQLSAEDATGGVLGTQLHRVNGKNKSAQELGQQGAAKAFSEAMRSLAETTDMVLRSARDQLSAQSMRISSDGEEIRALHELLREHRAAQLLQEAGSSSAVSDALLEQLKGAGPVLQGLAELWIDKQKAKAVEAAANAASKTVSAGAAAAKPVVTVTASAPSK